MAAVSKSSAVVFRGLAIGRSQLQRPSIGNRLPSATTSPARASMYSRIRSALTVPVSTAMYLGASYRWFLRELLPKPPELPQDHPFQQMHDLAHWLRRPSREQHVNMVTCRYPAEDLQLMFGRDTADHAAHANRAFSCEDRLPVHRNPHYMHFELRLRVRSQPIVSHEPRLQKSWFRQKAIGFHYPRYEQ